MPALLGGKRVLQIRGSKLTHIPPRNPTTNLRARIKVKLLIIRSSDAVMLRTSITHISLIIPMYLVRTPKHADPTSAPNENRKPERLLFDFVAESSFWKIPINRGSETTLNMAIWYPKK